MNSLDDGIRQRGRRRGVVFPIPLWNVYDQIHEDLPRTNNSVEGWHNAFNLRVGVSHPTVRKLVEKFGKNKLIMSFYYSKFVLVLMSAHLKGCAMVDLLTC